MSSIIKNLLQSLQTKHAPVTSAVGIDIGRTAIKIVELERSERAPVLKTYGEIQLGPYQNKPSGAAVDFAVDVFTQAAVDVMREAGAVSTQGILALPLSAGFVTVITLTTNTPEELANVIPVEARKVVPLPLNEITLDWMVIGQPVQNEQKKFVHTVLLVALQNDSVGSYHTLLRNLDMSGSPLELAMFSAGRALYSKTDPNYAVIDLGGHVSKLSLYENNTLSDLHRINNGGVAVTEKLSTLWELDFAAAEAQKRDVTSADADTVEDVKRATTAVLDTTLHEFQRLLQQFETKQSMTFSRVYICGGVASTIDVEQYVSDTLQRPVVRAFPFSAVGYPAFMEDMLRQYGPTFTNSLGAALRLLQ